MIFYPTVSCGELGKYARIPRVLLPASSWAGCTLRKHGIVRKIPVPTLFAETVDRAADCGGFVATKKWGEYKYSAAQYVDWLDGWHPTWAASMDYCCEDEITSGNAGIVRTRQHLTTEMAYHFWNTYQDAPWPWVPTVQGWTLNDYEYHAQEMKPLILDMHAHYGPQSAFRVGIGTLCRRASSEMIQDVVLAVSRILPDVPLHLWGVKLGLMQSAIALPAHVVSVDSAAWNGMFRTGREHWKASGLSQRQYCFNVALPAYEQKIQAALADTKQARMF
jgi:hypothetical protein